LAIAIKRPRLSAVYF